MATAHRKMGIIDPQTGDIVFVSRDEGHKYLKEAAQRTAVQTRPNAVKIKKEPGA